MGRLIFFLFVLLYSNCVFAQEEIGIANSNYAGTNGLYLNPASTSDSRVFINFNLVGANLYFSNNQVYLPQFSLVNAIRNGVQDPVVKDNATKKWFYGNFWVDGPAFTLSHNRFGLGFFTRARSLLDIRKIPSELANFYLNGFDYEEQLNQEFNFRNVEISNMTWVEWGINFSKMFTRHKRVMIFGGNLKYHTGINIAHYKLNQFNFTSTDTTFNVHRLNTNLRYNTGGWNSGKGWGLDLGVVYKKNLESADNFYAHSSKSQCKVIDYRYKIGLSLLDIGYVRFFKGTQKAHLRGSAEINSWDIDVNDAASLNDLYDANFVFTNQTNSSIWVLTPAAVSLQYDYNFDHNIYLNTTVVQNLLPKAITGPQRSSVLAVTPRFETKNFEAALPISMFKYRYPQVGLSFRIRSFVIGTDKLFPFLIKNDTYGANLYFNVKFAMYKNPACKSKSIERKVKKAIEKVSLAIPKPKHKKKSNDLYNDDPENEKELLECPELPVDEQPKKEKKKQKKIK